MNEQSVMTARDVAEFLKVSTWTVNELARKGSLPHFGVGRNRRFLKEDIEGWIKKERGA